MAEDKDRDQIVVANGQNEKARANSPKTRAKIKLWTKVPTEILSSIPIVQRDCRMSGKLTIITTTPFHKNNKLKAKITLYIKKADKRVKRKLAVDAALYKGMVLIEATLKTFCANSRR